MGARLDDSDKGCYELQVAWRYPMIINKIAPLESHQALQVCFVIFLVTPIRDQMSIAL